MEISPGGLGHLGESGEAVMRRVLVTLVRWTNVTKSALLCAEFGS